MMAGAQLESSGRPFSIMWKAASIYPGLLSHEGWQDVDTRVARNPRARLIQNGGGFGQPVIRDE